jgi:AraC-like DNA-binding protein
MGIWQRSAGLIDAAGQHAEDVYVVAQGGTPARGIDKVSTSWQRCVNQYGVDPINDEAPRILTSLEFKDSRQPLEQLISTAGDEIDRLYNLVREAGYTLLLCDNTGVAVEHRADDAHASLYKYWGIWLGAVWSEAAEGTNGIGTCIAEERPVTVHRSQHLRSRHITLSCSGAPIFGVDGRLMAVLDVSAFDPELSEGAHALTGPLTVTAARGIEERFFRDWFRREWIVAVSSYTAGVHGMLLAVDSSQRIVGGNRTARAFLLLDDHRLATGVSLWSIFERDHALFRRKDISDIPTRLVIAGSNENCPALVTPPESALGGRHDKTSRTLHTRPRLDLLSAVRQVVSTPHAHGGLAPGAMRRVREYVETHLSENIDLAVLASVAGFSVFHFAREFKRSAGVTPHHYLVQRRVERAQDMLARTDFNLAEIAVAAGFTDQSHLARQFRQILGVTPREFRWSLR